MVRTAFDIVLALPLAAAALAKLGRPTASAAELGELIAGGRRLWAVVALVEAALASAVAAGSAIADFAAGALLIVFALLLGRALRAGRAGQPCGCFGPRSRISAAAVVRNLVLAAAYAALGLAHTGLTISTDGALWIGLGVALCGVAALAVALLALAREVGMLRLRLAPAAALELPDEGPELGSRSAFDDRVAPSGGARYALAVFTSPGCRLCQALEPAVEMLASDPLLAVETFDETRDAAVWAALDVPGSPFAVALTLDGTVRAKGTFNTLGQLEGIVAAAERREREIVSG
jgi:hypothetical protein